MFLFIHLKEYKMYNFKDNIVILKTFIMLSAIVFYFVGCTTQPQELKPYHYEVKFKNHTQVEEGVTDGFRDYPNKWERVENE